MMRDESTSVFRFNFAAPTTATGQEPQQKVEKNEPMPGDDYENEILLSPPIEVFPNEVEAVTPFPVDLVVFQEGFTLLRGRVSTAKVIGVDKTDLLPGKYEGGLKLWECTIDLVNVIMREMKAGHLSLKEKRVLELGCGHGLPGIFAIVKGAKSVHFQDFNAEVLRSLTIPNVVANIDAAQQGTDVYDGVISKSWHSTLDVRYYAGDWGNVEELLSEAAHEQSSSHLGYEIILMSETVYSLQSLPKLYKLIKKCLRSPDGLLFVAGKKHYFGVGGGTRQFKTVVDEDGVLEGCLVTDFVDGSSNVREIWKFFFR
ncbi:unnamed protein product [Calypogeia fissa]